MKKPKFCLLFLVLGILLANMSYAVHYPLYLIRPKANLWSGKDRIYKAYPGLEYNIRAAAIGGEYPYRYTLSNEPSGMSIDEHTGEITWSNPQSSASNITVRVTDQDGDYVEGTWSITVTTSGFKFMDDDGSDSGNGTVSQPWKTISKLASSASTTDIVYWREGTWTGQQNPSNYDNWIGRGDNSIPRIWIGYPSETPIIDLNLNGNKIGIGTAVYFDNMTFRNAVDIMFYVASNVSYYCFRRLTLSNIDRDGRSNKSFFRFEAADYGQYFVLQDSTLSDTESEVKGLSIYHTFGMLLEDNTLSSIGHTGFDLKEGVRQFTVRGNHFDGITSGNGAGPGLLNSADGQKSYGEWCFNYCEATSQGGVALRIPADSAFDPGVFYVYRNTIYGWINFAGLDSGDGPYYFENNVIINSDSGDHINGSGTNIHITDNLVGNASDNIIDPVGGNLTQEYLVFLGTRGWETSIKKAPKSPTGLTVIGN